MMKDHKAIIDNRCFSKELERKDVVVDLAVDNLFSSLCQSDMIGLYRERHEKGILETSKIGHVTRKGLLGFCEFS